MAAKLVQHKEKGFKQFEQREWQEAINEFTIVIDQLKPESEEDVLLLFACLLQRSVSFLLLEKTEEAFNDANTVIDTYKQRRPENIFTNPSVESLRSDAFIPSLSVAFVRRGQVLEYKGQLMAALQEYTKGVSLVPDGEGRTALDRVYEDLGIAKIEGDEPEIQPFKKVFLDMMEKDKLIESLKQCLDYINKTTFNEEQQASLNSKGCGREFYGIIQIYINEEDIVLTSIKCEQGLAKYSGIPDVWAGYQIIKHIFDSYNDNAVVCSTLLEFINMAPPEIMPYIEQTDVFRNICASFNLEMTPEQRGLAYDLLSNLSSSPNQLLEVASQGFIEKAWESKCEGSFCLLSRLCTIPEYCKKIIDLGILDWSFQNLTKEDATPKLLSASIIVFIKIILLEEHPPIEGKVFDAVAPVIIAKNKLPDVVSSGFAALSLCLPEAADKILGSRILTAASVLLSYFMDDIVVATNIITFLYECASAGKAEDIKQARAVFNTSMKALQNHPDSEVLVERAVGLAILCDHPNKDTLLSAALQQFPQSKFLQQFNIVQDK